MAHQDVVPAASLSRWSHPPFEPYYDGQFLWGRGSSDCKNNLIGILSDVESLLEQAWKPHRTLVLAFGFDEETGGIRGAAGISQSELNFRYILHYENAPRKWRKKKIDKDGVTQSKMLCVDGS